MRSAPSFPQKLSWKVRSTINSLRCKNVEIPSPTNPSVTETIFVPVYRVNARSNGPELVVLEDKLDPEIYLQFLIASFSEEQYGIPFDLRCQGSNLSVPTLTDHSVRDCEAAPLRWVPRVVGRLPARLASRRGRTAFHRSDPSRTLGGDHHVLRHHDELPRRAQGHRDSMVRKPQPAQQLAMGANTSFRPGYMPTDGCRACLPTHR